MHQMQRLRPPYFYILLFILYEIPILALAVVGSWFFDVPGAVRLWRRHGGRRGCPEGSGLWRNSGGRGGCRLRLHLGRRKIRTP